ncbi:MAG TPA: DUF4956 domain-containing protein [Pyrinomonadaceae bacterium]|jgi:hypothetical protein
MNKLSVVLVATFVAFLLASGTIAYLLHDRSLPASSAGANASPAANTQTPVDDDKDSRTPSVAQNNVHPQRSFLSELFAPEETLATHTGRANWVAITARISLKFSLAALLAVLLAFRPRRGVPVIKRNPYVAQTQILLAVVAAAMMMIVGDSTARAFGIFAAASLINFRTNIRDPKEITILLICLGVGLASGVGRWEIAILLSLFVLLTLWILEYFEPAHVFRTMDIQVETRNVDTTHEVLKQVFARHGFDTELRELNRPDEDEPMGKIVYCVSMSTTANTDKLSEEIMSKDTENIDSIEWEQRKSTTYFYQ